MCHALQCSTNDTNPINKTKIWARPICRTEFLDKALGLIGKSARSTNHVKYLAAEIEMNSEEVWLLL